MHIEEVAAAVLPAIHRGGQGNIELGTALVRVELISRYKTWPKAHCEVLALGRATCDRVHLATLQVARAPIIEHGVSDDVVFGLAHVEVDARLADDRGNLEF